MDAPLPLQVIAQGLLTVSGAAAATPHVPTFSGRGISDVVRVAVVGPPAGITYVLTLDEGLPGNSGEVAAEGSAYAAALQPGAGSGATSLTNVPTPDIRCSVVVRGSTTNALAAGGTTVASVSVQYLTPGADGGFTQVALVFQDAAGAAVDITDAVAAGAEIIVYKDASALQ